MPPGSPDRACGVHGVTAARGRDSGLAADPRVAAEACRCGILACGDTATTTPAATAAHRPTVRRRFTSRTPDSFRHGTRALRTFTPVIQARHALARQYPQVPHDGVANAAGRVSVANN